MTMRELPIASPNADRSLSGASSSSDEMGWAARLTQAVNACVCAASPCASEGADVVRLNSSTAACRATAVLRRHHHSEAFDLVLDADHARAMPEAVWRRRYH